MNVTTSNKRLLALDVMRGITIAGMILVNTPGSWQHAYAPLKHAEWIGLTPTDLVFPFFMFIMGISTYISLRKYNFTFSVPAGLKFSTDRDHFPDWNWHQLAFHSLLPARSLPYRPDSHSRSHATACFGIWSYCHSRFTHEA